MALDLYYFISTLPSLTFSGEGAPTWVCFEELCKDALTQKQLRILDGVTLCPPPQLHWADKRHAIIHTWYSWQTEMRNLIVLYRARLLKSDGGKYQREEDEGTGYTSDLRSLEAILEEKTAWKRQLGWEKLQWSKLNELEPLVKFSFDALIVYALKLKLLESRRNYSTEAGKAVFEEIIKARLAEAAAHRVQSEG